jgi:hypothetical protein
VKRLKFRPPIEISLLIGEILYQCRSALDHLFFELVRQKGAPSEKDWEEHRQFPLAKKSSSFPGKLKGWLPPPILATLEKMQPYRRGNDLNDTLRYLRILSNIDKHRKLSITVIRVNVYDTFIASNGINVTIIHSMLSEGAELPWPSPLPAGFAEHLVGDVNVKRKLIPVIALDEPEIGRPEAHPIESIVHRLPSILIGFIIPVIRDLINKL